MAGGFWEAADDMVRLAANGLTFGAADRIAAALGEEDTAAKTAAAARRAGFAGDLAGAVGVGGGAKLLWQGAKQLPRIVRAAPKVARAAVSKKGLAGAGVGGLALVNYNSRTAGDAAVAAESQSPTAVPVQPRPRQSAAPDGAPSLNSAGRGSAANTMTDDIMASLGPAATPTFASMAAEMAASQGGSLSMRQMSGLADIANKLEVTGAGRQPTYKDVAGQEFMKIVDTNFAKAQAEAQALRAAGNPQEAQRVWNEGYAERQAQLEKMLGADSVDEAIAARIRAAGQVP